MRRLALLLLLWMQAAAEDDYTFWTAIADGDAAMAKQLLADDAVDMEYFNDDGKTPLLIAVTSEQPAMVRLLIEAGADAEALGQYPFAEDTPLGTAAGLGSIDMLECLLDAGAGIDAPGNDGRTPLMMAVLHNQPEAARWLMARGANVNREKIDGTTALFWAVRNGDVELATTLIETGCNASAVDSTDGSRPIHFAAQSLAPTAGECIELLLAHGANALERTHVMGPREELIPEGEEVKREQLRGGQTPLMVAASVGSVPSVEALVRALPSPEAIDMADIQGFTALTFAAQGGHKHALLALLAAGARTDAYTAEGRTALHLATFEGRTRSVLALLKHGVDVNQPSTKYHSALLIASFHGYDRIVKLLLKRGAYVDARAEDGATPLIGASSGGHYRVAKRLLRAGANVLSRLEAGETAASVTKNKRLARYLYRKEYKLIEEYKGLVKDEELAAMEERMEAQKGDGDEVMDLDLEEIKAMEDEDGEDEDTVDSSEDEIEEGEDEEAGHEEL